MGEVTVEQANRILTSTYKLIFFYLASLTGMFLLGLWIGSHFTP